MAQKGFFDADTRPAALSRPASLVKTADVQNNPDESPMTRGDDFAALRNRPSVFVSKIANRLSGLRY